MREWHGLKAWHIILIKQPMKLLDLEKHYDTNQRLIMDMYKSKITSFILYPSRFDQTKCLTLFGANYLFLNKKISRCSNQAQYRSQGPYDLLFVNLFFYIVPATANIDPSTNMFINLFLSWIEQNYCCSSDG
jgi:hypothetical protein